MATFLICGTAQAQWTLIDDFSDHTVGDPVEGFVGSTATWTGNLAGKHSIQVDPTDAKNNAMQLTGEPGGGALRAEITDASDFIAFGATGTLFYRFRTAVTIDNGGGGTDHVVGLTDNNLITNFNFKSGLRNINTATVPSNRFDLRDGVSPGYEEVAQLLDNTWYSLWMVSTNTNPGTHQCYLQSDTDPNFATQTLLASDSNIFNYRIMGNTDIINVYFRNANNDAGVAGNDMYFDDIYLNSSAADLTDPRPAPSVLRGDVSCDGIVNFLDIAPFIDRLSTGVFQAEADVDESGLVNFLDISPFIGILSGQ